MPDSSGRMRSLSVQLVLWVILPLTVALLLAAFSSAILHSNAMRSLIASRDQRAVSAAAAWLAERWEEGDPQEQLQGAADLLASEPDTRVVLVGPEQILARPADPARDWNQHPGVQALSRGQAGSTYFSPPDSNDPLVIAYHPIGESGWGLLIEQPWSSIASPHLRLTQLAPLALIPAVLLAVVALIFGLRQIVRPLQVLERQAAQLGCGDFGSIQEPTRGIGEIQALHATLRTMADELCAAQDSLRLYTAALTRAQEEERARLARELHDETVQTLIALEHQLHRLRRRILNDPQAAADRAQELTLMAGEAVQEIRRIISDLRPLYLEDLGWLPGVKTLLNEMEKGTGIKADLRVTGAERRLDPATELALYRISQEALNNINRHSEAGRVSVQIDYTPEKVRLTVIDDGRGFTADEQAGALLNGAHYGLMGMRERAQLIGAHLLIDSSPGQGTRVQVTVAEQQT